MKRLWAEISKAEEQADGTMIVSGYASSPTPDSDGEIVTSAAIEKALPDYMRFGAVREMHQPKAAGNALEAYVEPESGKTFFSAHVVDESAVKKVKNKVYKGFSIGGKVLERSTDDPNVITAIKLVEVSLVDRPANPDAVFTMYKADDVENENSLRELEAIQQLSDLVNKGAIVPSKLVELAKIHIQGERNMELQKSLWDVADLAALLGQLKSIQSCLAFDAAYEGEISPASMKLKEDIANLATTLIALIGEEIPETNGMSEGEEEIGGAADPSVNDQIAIEGQGAKEVADDASTDKSEGEGETKGDDEEDEEKSESKKTKKGIDIDDLAKVVGAAVQAAVDPLVKRIQILEAQPAPSKGVLKVVGKGQDIEKSEGAVDDTPPADLSPAEQAAWEIKKLHRTGGLL